jgi:hypothetical protein
MADLGLLQYGFRNAAVSLARIAAQLHLQEVTVV